MNQKSRVAAIACASYHKDAVKNAVFSALDECGDLSDLFHSGQHVHIKPNMLTAKPPESAAITHPAVVQAVIEYIRRHDIRVTIGDSPAGISQPVPHYWKVTGLQAVAEQTGAELVAFEKKGVVERDVNGRRYYVAEIVAQADVVINICKMKTHGLTLMTGAVKNMFGVIPGIQKGEFHKKYPRVQDFAEVLVDVYQSVKPQLSIMDAVVAMEGNGPSSGSPKHVGYILASRDAVAMDAVAAHLMGFAPRDILTTAIAARRHLGMSDLSAIEIRGEDISSTPGLQFHLPSNRFVYYLPESLIKFVARFIWIRPKADKATCKKCGICIRNCPVQAMHSEDGIPIIDYDTCIKCFCCDESCPHGAIKQEMSWLAKKLQ